MNTRVPVAAGALLCVLTVGTLYAGYTSKNSLGVVVRKGRPLSDEPKEGTPPGSPSEKDLVCCAIDQLEAGAGDMIKILNKLKKNGQICAETMVNKESSAQGGPNGNLCNGKINLEVEGMCEKTGLQIILMHELGHIRYPEGAMTPAQEHCTIRWSDWWRLKCKGTENWSDAEFLYYRNLSRWYPNFVEAEQNGATKTDPAPGLPDVNDPKYPAGCSNVAAEVRDKNTLRKKNGSFTSSPGSVFYIAWWYIDDNDEYGGVFDANVETGMSVVRDFVYYETPWNGSPSETGVILVAGLDSTGTFGEVRAISDEDDDGIPETLCNVVGLGDNLISPSSVEAVHQISGSFKWYVLDDATEQIYNLVDNDSDGIPDGLGGVFATSAQFPELSSGRHLDIYGTSDDDGVPLSSGILAVGNRSRYEDWAAPSQDWQSTFSDVDGDGVADFSSGPVLIEDLLQFAPILLSPPCTGVDFAVVYGAKGHTVELRAQDGAGEYSVVLGSGVVSSHPYRASFPLSRMLVASETVILRDVQTGLDSQPIAIGPANRPWVLHADPQVGPRCGGTAVTLTGWDFLPTTQVFMMRPIDDALIPVQVLGTTASEIQFLTPPLPGPAETSEVWVIRVEDPRSLEDDLFRIGFEYEP